jgi:hypothetical protein
VCSHFKEPESAAQYLTLGHVCEPEEILLEDGVLAELGRQITDVEVDVIETKNITACVEVDFGEPVSAQYARVVIYADEQACGASCSSTYCGSGQTVTLFGRVDGADYAYAGGAEITGTLTSYDVDLVSTPLQYLLVCRGGWGPARDHLKVDYVELCY